MIDWWIDWLIDGESEARTVVEEVEEVQVEEKQWATPRGNEGRLDDVVQHQRACREREKERKSHLEYWRLGGGWWVSRATTVTESQWPTSTHIHEISLPTIIKRPRVTDTADDPSIEPFINSKTHALSLTHFLQCRYLLFNFNTTLDRSSTRTSTHITLTHSLL